MNLTFWSDSVVPSITANSIQVMKMCDAFTRLGHSTTLHAKTSTCATASPLSDLSELYGITTDFRVINHSSHNSIRHLDYDLKVLASVLRSEADLIYTRSLRGALFANLFAKKNILELHFLPSTPASTWILKKLSNSNNLQKIIVISNRLKELLLDKHPYLSTAYIEVCHDAVDIDRFSDSNRYTVQGKGDLNLNSLRKTIMYVGHLYQGRGINLIEQLAEKLPEIDFIVIGGTEKDVLYRQARLTKIGISNLIYYGFIPNSKLHNYYQMADILIMPYQKQVSVSSGGNTADWMSPMKTFEYMASGKPLISSDLPALREVLNEDIAVLVEPDNVEQWKSSIENTLTNPVFANKIARNARQIAEENTWESRARKILGCL
ncbi:MAG: hypothetical protein CMF45_00910 [Legionellales bacterium]|nr:hypothetical protein [Legionellales bacterium]|tara:strand:- start:2127 stop:3260 length:1134 start_codon:yes stop_codon:yes gene_type:complete